MVNISDVRTMEAKEALLSSLKPKKQEAKLNKIEGRLGMGGIFEFSKFRLAAPTSNEHYTFR